MLEQFKTIMEGLLHVEDIFENQVYIRPSASPYLYFVYSYLLFLISITVDRMAHLVALAAVPNKGPSKVKL